MPHKTMKKQAKIPCGQLTPPKVISPSGFWNVLNFLEAQNKLRSGDTADQAMMRCGVVFTENENAYDVIHIGFFAENMFTAEARDLLEALAKDGFEGQVYLKTATGEAEAILSRGRCHVLEASKRLSLVV